MGVDDQAEGSGRTPEADDCEPEAWFLWAEGTERTAERGYSKAEDACASGEGVCTSAKSECQSTAAARTQTEGYGS